MKTPKFFFQPFGLFALTLLPFSFIFFVLSVIKKLFTVSRKLEGKFIICIGNVTAGGGGKTPTAVLLAEMLKEIGLEFAFLSKGYGRKSKGFFKLENSMEVLITGDEPQILKQHAPVFLFSKYKEIVQNLSNIPQKILIMDDGMQNNFIKKDLTVLIIDGKNKFGNGALLPAGPLREFPYFAIKKADLIFEIEPKTQLFKNSFILNRKYNFNDNKAENFIAFSGLAINQKFFDSLKQLNINVVKFIEYEDHKTYTLNDIKILEEIAKKHNAKLITTEKDFVKIKKFSTKIAVLKMSLYCDKREKLKLNFFKFFNF